jgi:hypothetical protein
MPLTIAPTVDFSGLLIRSLRDIVPKQTNKKQGHLGQSFFNQVVMHCLLAMV